MNTNSLFKYRDTTFVIPVRGTEQHFSYFPPKISVDDKHE